jgi:transposase InsO family protein
LDLVGSL